jgi:hypothetical protein
VARQRGEHLLHVDRLGDEIVHAGVRALLAFGLHHTGRHGDHRQRQSQLVADFCVAVKPSITGICTSISTRS